MSTRNNTGFGYRTVNGQGVARQPISRQSEQQQMNYQDQGGYNQPAGYANDRDNPAIAWVNIFMVTKNRRTGEDVKKKLGSGIPLGDAKQHELALIHAFFDIDHETGTITRNGRDANALLDMLEITINASGTNADDDVVWDLFGDEPESDDEPEAPALKAPVEKPAPVKRQRPATRQKAQPASE